MSSNIERQVASILEELGAGDGAATCTTCPGSSRLHILVPDPDDVHLPEHNPTHRPECGRSLKGVRHLVGVPIESVDRLLTASDGTVHEMDCPARRRA